MITISLRNWYHCKVCSDIIFSGPSNLQTTSMVGFWCVTTQVHVPFVSNEHICREEQHEIAADKNLLHVQNLEDCPKDLRLYPLAYFAYVGLNCRIIYSFVIG